MTAIFAVPVLAFLWAVESAMPHHEHMANRLLPAAVALLLIVAFHAWRKRKAKTAGSQRSYSTSWR